jgi:hypothetical protein
MAAMYREAQRSRKAAAGRILLGGAMEMSADADGVVWDRVASMWKDDDGSNFERKTLEKLFPAHRSKRSERRSIWKAMDSHRNGYVSLADFDKWFNEHTLRVERSPGKKSAVYLYAKHGLIRAFELANGIAPKRTGVCDSYVTWSELRLLLLATQLVLVITRIFDIADTSGDKRVGAEEWVAGLDAINEELEDLGCSHRVTAKEFNVIDNDGCGHVLLDEAVYYFLHVLCDDPVLVAESRAEGC